MYVSKSCTLFFVSVNRHFPFFCLQNCPQLLEYNGEIELCRHKGAANIRARLQVLNGKIRSGQDKVWLL